MAENEEFDEEDSEYDDDLESEYNDEELYNQDDDNDIETQKNFQESQIIDEEDDEEEEISNDEMNVSLASLIGRIKKNVLLMLMDRGIEILEEEKHLLTLNNLEIFCKCLQNKKRNFFNLEYGTILVHFVIKGSKKKVCLKEVKDIFKKKLKFTKFLLIIPDKLSFDANLEIQKYKNVEIFTYDFFLFSLPRHEFVPKHTLLTEKEKNQFLKFRNLELYQIPLIRQTDPIIKYYGWEKENIVKIQRPGRIVYRSIL